MFLIFIYLYLVGFFFFCICFWYEQGLQYNLFHYACNFYCCSSSDCWCFRCCRCCCCAAVAVAAVVGVADAVMLIVLVGFASINFQKSSTVNKVEKLFLQIGEGRCLVPAIVSLFFLIFFSHYSFI